MLNNWLNRATKQMVWNTSPSDMGYVLSESNATWIYDPDLSSVTGIPSKYWIITGDVITEMSQGEKDAIDAQALIDSRDSIISQMEQTEDILRQVIILLVSEINILRSEHGLADRTFTQLKTAIRNGLGS